MLTDDDWADIWRKHERWYNRGNDTRPWLGPSTRRRIAKLVDAKLREKAEADE